MPSPEPSPPTSATSAGTSTPSPPTPAGRTPPAEPGAAVRAARLGHQRRNRAIRLVVLAALVAGIAFVTYRVVHEEPPPFRFVEETTSASSSDGEGLMGARRTLRQEPLDPDPGADGPYLLALRGPGSTVLSFVELELDRDAPAMRIRQRGTRIDDHVVTANPDGTVETPDPGLRWQGWVATQPRDYGDARDGVIAPPLRWRSAGGEAGVVVRPGERIRLRTRYDVPSSQARECTTRVVDGTAGWDVMEDGDDPGGNAGKSVFGDWVPLRARSERREDDRAVVRTGQRERIAFVVGRPGCTGGSLGGLAGSGLDG